METDAQVQVVAQAVANNANVCHGALDSKDMGYEVIYEMFHILNCGFEIK